MGQAKHAWMEEQERGWSDPETFVCDQCVREPYLAQLVRDQAEQRQCDYCKRRGRSPIAAPAATVIDAIAQTIHTFYNDPNNAGVPYDGVYIIESVDTAEVLLGFPLDCSDEFFEGLTEAFIDGNWVPAAQGHWSTSHLSDRMGDSWRSFVRLVKHSTRYHFAQQPPDDMQELSAVELLEQIGAAVRTLKATRTLAEGTAVHRVRVRHLGQIWEASQTTMGAPPSEAATAGRMNPAGISYFYGALEGETAIAEVVASPPVDLVVAQFALSRPVLVLDLCELPPSPSIFDGSRRDEFQWLSFSRSFARAISQPVRKDGSEHVDYVPSQVVCEWFAQVYNATEQGARLDGILYPSAVAPGGKNLVLFPSRESYQRKFDSITYREHAELVLDNWAQLAGALGFSRAVEPPIRQRRRSGRVT